MSAGCKIQFGGQFVDKTPITKTLDPLIKSQLLYQLSYGVF